jgi:ABC-2 type transport system permease protein
VRLLANVLAVLPLVILFLLLARLWDVRPPALGYPAALPALVLAGLMLGAFGLLLSSLVPRLENFAGVMNFVIFPMFFASTALYPLWRLEDASPLLAMLARLNPFTHAVELIRFALYLRLEPLGLAVTAGTFGLFFGLAVLGYDPGRGLWTRRRSA